MTVSIWQADGRAPTLDVDFLVVGAGLVGCAAAYFATQAGHTVTITDARAIGLGASSRNAGFMLTGTDEYYHTAIEHYGHAIAREIWQLSRRTHQHWHAFMDAAPGTVEYQRSGSLLLAESATEAADLALAIRAMDADRLPAHFHSRDPLGRGYCAAIEQPEDGAVQPYQLTQAIFKASDAAFIGENEAYRVEQSSPDQVTVYTRRHTIRARYALLCTNAYSPYIHPYFADKVIPTRAQCLVTEPLTTGPVLPTCGYSDYGYMYYRETFDGRLLIGGGRKQNKPLEHDTTDDRITAPVQAILDGYLRQWFPEVAAKVERRWAGIMGFTPDGLPLVGTLPDAPRIGFAVGFNGHGLALGAGTAERAVDHLLKGISAGAVSADRLR